MAVCTAREAEVSGKTVGGREKVRPGTGREAGLGHAAACMHLRRVLPDAFASRAGLFININ